MDIEIIDLYSDLHDDGVEYHTVFYAIHGGFNPELVQPERFDTFSSIEFDIKAMSMDVTKDDFDSVMDYKCAVIENLIRDAQRKITAN